MSKDMELIKEAIEYTLGADLTEENGWAKEYIESLNKLKNEEFTITFKKI